jgi:transposase InsO family protein
LILIAGRYTKEAFYAAIGVTRQFLYKRKRRKEQIEEIVTPIVTLVQKKREQFKKLGSRRLFYLLNIENIGINRFEKIVSENNLTVKIKKKRIITTQGYYEEGDINLLNGKELNDINQVIAGDITYLKTHKITFYICALKDMYSKRIVGLYGSDNMLATTIIKALRQAIKLRGKGIHGCIHHSDAGSQYKSHIYKDLIKQHHIVPSIAENCLQNGMAEQLNGAIKNDYMLSNIRSVKELNKVLTHVKKTINEQIPVANLGYMTPVQYEEYLKTVPLPNRKIIKLYDFNDKKGDFLQA